MIATAVLAGCGHVRIQTNEPDARIYANGVFLGKGYAELPHRMGPPASIQITAKGENAMVSRTIRREITVVTLAFGLYSYFTSFVWGWQYPELVTLTLPRPEAAGGWEDAPSPWDSAPAASAPEPREERDHSAW